MCEGDDNSSDDDDDDGGIDCMGWEVIDKSGRSEVKYALFLYDSHNRVTQDTH